MRLIACAAVAAAIAIYIAAQLLVAHAPAQALIEKESGRTALAHSETINDRAIPRSTQAKLTSSLSPLATGDVYEIALENYGADSEAVTAVYEMQGRGFFTSPTCTTEITTTAGLAVPSKDGLTFGGYWTEENGTGTCFIGADGFLTVSASSTAFEAPGTLYARWYATVSYLDADLRTACAWQEVPINVPTEPLDIDDIPYSKKPPAECGWELDCYIDWDHTIDVSDYQSALYGDNDNWMPVPEVVNGEVDVSYAYKTIPTRYYADEDAKFVIQEPIEVDIEWRRTIHFTYYVDGLTTLTKEDRIPQGYMGGAVCDLTYEYRRWGTQTEKYWTRYTTSSFPPQHIYDSVELPGGWEMQGWVYYNAGEVPESKPVYIGSSTNSWPELYLPSSKSHHVPTSVTCWNTTWPDDGNYWYAVYERSVPMTYDACGGAETVPTTYFKQSITATAPLSTKPYGWIGGGDYYPAGSNYSFTKAGYRYLGMTYDDPDAYSYIDDPTASSLYYFGQPMGKGAANAAFGTNDAWTSTPSTLKMYAQYTVNQVEINLEDPSMVSTTTTEKTLYYKQDVGYYIDNQCLQRMTPAANPITAPRETYSQGAEFLGYWTKPEAKGLCYIGANGYLTTAASTTAFPDGGTLYAAWSIPQAAYDSTTHTLTFFRSSENTDGYGTLANGTIEDITGVTHTGTLFGSIVNNHGVFSTIASGLETARVEDGQTVVLNDLAYMFSNCKKLTRTSGFERIDVSNCNSAAGMFYNCESLIDPPNTSTWDFSNVQNVNEMFCGCKNMTSAPDTRTWGMGNCRYLTYMFEWCYKMKTAPDMSNWDTANFRNIDEMFFECMEMAETPNTTGWNLENCTSASAVFYECNKMTEAPDTSTWGLGKCTDLNYLFARCYYMKTAPDTSNWNTANVTDMSAMFASCMNMRGVPDTSGWDTSKVTNMYFMFGGCDSMDGTPVTTGWDTANVENMDYMFYNCQKMQTPPDTSGWDVGKVTTMYWMFACDYKMKNAPDTSGWRPSNLVNAVYMFNTCSAMQDAPDMSGWDTRSLGSIRAMFWKCTSMKTAPDMSNWDTSSLEEVNGLFGHCTSIQTAPKMFNWEVPAGKFDSPVNLECVFTYCRNMTGKLDLSGWKLDDPGSVYLLFGDCNKIESIDVSGLSTANVPTMSGIFAGCNFLKQVALGKGFVFNDAVIDSSDYADYGTLLPTTASGYWINSTHEDSSVVTPQELHDGFSGTGSDNSYNAGLYCAALPVTYNNNTTQLDSTYMPWSAAWPLESTADLSGLPDLPSGCGWGFKGWALANDTDDTVYTDAERVAFTDGADLYCVYSRDLKFTHYKTDTATVTSVDVVEQTYRSGELQSIVTPPMTASMGYSWLPSGWLKSSSATAPSSSSDVDVTLDFPLEVSQIVTPAADDAELYWYGVYSRPAQIAYNGNRHTSGATTATDLTQYFTAGASESTAPAGTLAANGYEKTDCAFWYWALDGLAGEAYDESATIADDENVGLAQAWASTAPTHTMYARWLVMRMSFSVPSSVTFLVRPDGKVLTATEQAQAIENTSAFPIDVTGLRVEEAGSSLTLTDTKPGPNEMNVSLTPTGYGKLNLYDYISDTIKAVSEGKWHIEQAGELGLDFEADDVERIDDIKGSGAKMAGMEWKVTPDV